MRRPIAELQRRPAAATRNNNNNNNNIYNNNSNNNNNINNNRAVIETATSTRNVSATESADKFSSKHDLLKDKRWTSSRNLWRCSAGLWLVLLVLLPHLSVVHAQKNYDELKKADIVGFESITQLHHAMDDDQSGSIDLSETKDFVLEEIEIGDDEQERINRRQTAFHANDDEHITVDDLWQHWIESVERNWTVDDTLQWLVEGVELPQYIEAFQKNAIDGQALPRLAVINSSFMSTVLGVHNPVHRHKLQLKAMDVVLFGYRIHNSVWKDYLVSTLLASIIGLVAFYSKQKKKALMEKESLEKQMAVLQEIEDQYHDIQVSLQEEKKKQDDIRSEATCEQQEKHEEIQMLRMQLYEAEQRLEQGSTMGAPLALQPLLKKTCDNEMNSITNRIVTGRQRMREAIDLVEKLKRKQATVINSFKLAVGTSSSTEELDSRIATIRTEMEQCLKALSEANSRWSQIESLCGFALVNVGSVGAQLLPTITEYMDSVNYFDWSSFADQLGMAMKRKRSSCAVVNLATSPTNHSSMHQHGSVAGFRVAAAAAAHHGSNAHLAQAPSQADLLLFDDSRSMTSAAAMQQVRSVSRMNPHLASPTSGSGSLGVPVTVAHSQSVSGMHRSTTSSDHVSPPIHQPPMVRPTFTLDHGLTNDDTRSSGSGHAIRPTVLPTTVVDPSGGDSQSDSSGGSKRTPTPKTSIATPSTATARDSPTTPQVLLSPSKGSDSRLSQHGEHCDGKSSSKLKNLLKFNKK